MRKFNLIIAFCFLSFGLKLIGQDKTVLLVSFVYSVDDPTENVYWVADPDSVTETSINLHPLAINWDAMNAMIEAGTVFNENYSAGEGKGCYFKRLLYQDKLHRKQIQTFMKSWLYPKRDFEYVNVYVCPFTVSDYEVTPDGYYAINEGIVSYDEGAWAGNWYDSIAKMDFSEFGFLEYTFGYNRNNKPIYRIKRADHEEVSLFEKTDEFLMVSYFGDTSKSIWLVDISHYEKDTFLAVRMADNIFEVENDRQSEFLNELIGLNLDNMRPMMEATKNWPNIGLEYLRVFALPVKGKFAIIPEEEIDDGESEGRLKAVPVSKIEINDSFWETRCGYLFQNMEYQKFNFKDKTTAD